MRVYFIYSYLVVSRFEERKNKLYIKEYCCIAILKSRNTPCSLRSLGPQKSRLHSCLILRHNVIRFCYNVQLIRFYRRDARAPRLRYVRHSAECSDINNPSTNKPSCNHHRRERPPSRASCGFLQTRNDGTINQGVLSLHQARDGSRTLRCNTRIFASIHGCRCAFQGFIRINTGITFKKKQGNRRLFV